MRKQFSNSTPKLRSDLLVSSRRRVSGFGIVIALAIGAIIVEGRARADVFVLNNGGRIHGRWVNRADEPLTEYVIETPQMRLKLAKDQVREAIVHSSRQPRYEELAPTFADTIEEQWRLAEWCRNNGLPDKRQVHLQRVIELDPDHAKARHGLGYAFIGGRWVLRDEWRKEQGLVFYRGRWRSPQEAELLDAEEKKERAESEWMVKLKRLRRDLGTNNGGEAYRQIASIRDSHAVPALVEYLNKERYRAVKLLFVEVLGGIDSSRAIDALINTSMNDPDMEVFHACVDEIVRLHPPQAARAYIRGLNDANNVRVNRAAIALGQLEDPEAIPALIGALVTSHVIVIGSPSRGSGDSISTAIGGPVGSDAAGPLPSDGTTFVAGDQTKVIPVQVPNQDVLASLVKLSGGVSFGFNEQAWSNWYVAQRKSDIQLSPRRDGS